MSRSRLTIVIVIVAILIWTIFAPQEGLQNLRMKLTNVARAPLKITTSLFSHIKRISTLPYTDKEKTASKKTISRLERRIAELEELSLENDRLRDLLGFKQRHGAGSIPALIIGRDPNNWSSVVFIDIGARDGAKKDMVVISGEGLVGRVREVGDSMGKVMLINDVDSRVGAIVQHNREQGVLTGTPAGLCKLIYLSLDSEIMEGDRVLTSGLGGIYPKGILIGTIIEVSKEKGVLYKYAIVEPACKLSKLEEVLCIE